MVSESFGRIRAYWRVGQTSFVDIVSVVLHVGGVLVGVDGRFLANWREALGHDDQFLTGEVVFLDGLADDFFGDAVGVDLWWRIHH